MRVMHLESGRNLYGGAEQVRYLIEGLSALGIDNVLVCARGSAMARAAEHPAASAHEGALPPAGDGAGAQIVTLPMGGDLDPTLVPRLARVLKTYAPDLLHVHSRRGADLFGGCSARLARVAAVLTRRVDNPEPPGWARFKYRPYEAVIAISRAVEAQLLDHVGLERARVHRVASAVDSVRFRPDSSARGELTERFGCPDDAVIAGVVAQLIARKGHALLLGALGAPLARHPELRVLCFGRGPLEGALAQRIAELGLEHQVKLVGFHDDMHRLMPGLDLLVHPAEREGLGVAVLEAMSAGVPVVATAVGGLPDVIEDGTGGVLVEPGDARALAAAVDALVADPGLRARLGAAARTRVKQAFSVAQMSAGNLAVYREVLEGRHGTV
jgi:glycosyltransferase involved in cell wall biosynthesis